MAQDLDKLEAAAAKAKATYRSKQTPKNKEAHRAASRDLSDARTARRSNKEG